MKSNIIIFKLGCSIVSGFLLISCICPQDKDSDQYLDKDFFMITPFVNISDMAPINEAFSVDSNCPWGFEQLNSNKCTLRN